MSRAREMLDAAPKSWRLDRDDVVAAIDACDDCAQACTTCADACLNEDDVADLRACIVLDADCADICTAMARVLSRQSLDDPLLVQRLLDACVYACAACAEECERHAAHHRHCAICAEVCRSCEQACRRLLEAEALAELQSLAGG